MLNHLKEIAAMNEELTARNEEISAMNEELNAQNEEISAMNEELVSQNDKIIALNEEIAGLNRELIKMNECLEQRVNERTAELATARHELALQYEILKERERELSTLMSNLQGMVYYCSNDEYWSMRFVSDGARQLTGYSADELVDNRVVDYNSIIHPDDRDMVFNTVRQGISNRSVFLMEYRIITKDNSIKYVMERGQGFFAPNGELIRLEGFVSDITERMLSQEALSESVAKYKALMEQSPAPVVICEPETCKIIEANRRFTEQFGYAILNNKELNLTDLFVDDAENIARLMTELKNAGYLKTQRRTLIRQDGTLADVDRTATMIRYCKKSLMVVTIIDVSDEVRRATESHYQATHDDLTGLYNRRGFIEAMSEKVVSGTGGALLIVNFDDFKLINDVHGHALGEKLLVSFAAYLRENYSESAVISRVGGDEFILFFSGEEGLHAAIRAGNQFESVCLPIDTGFYFAQLSGGVSILEQDNILDFKIQQAYLALHHAKESGKRCIKTYESFMQENVSRRYAIKEALNNALTNNELYLVFQPIYDIKVSGARLDGYEALLRWTNPKLGVISPAEFIPIAEETNLIIEIGSWVLREACRFSVELQEKFGEFVSVSVNISMCQLALPNFVSTVKRTISESGLPAAYLNLEMTESILMTDVELRISRLKDLREYGISISLDDFGTGYSSFTYLSQMPINTLKIDKSLVQEIGAGCEDKSLLLIESLLQLSSLLGFNVVAEGVETQEQFIFLQRKGCSHCQGFLFNKPLLAADALAIYDRR